MILNPVTDSLGVLRRNRTAYLAANAVFYGLVSLGILLAARNPDLHRGLLLSAKHSVLYGGGGVSWIVRMFGDGTPIALPIGVIFLVNLVNGAFLLVSLPSLVIPFLGWLVLALWSLVLGLTFGAEEAFRPSVLGLILLEGQGYILAPFACYLHGMQFLRPSRYGFSTRKEAFTAGLKVHARFYTLIAAVLLIAACYEGLVIKAALNAIPADAVASAEKMSSGPSLRLAYSGSRVFYRSDVTPGDARIAGLLLEEMHYFQAGRQGSAHLEKTDSAYHLRVFLKEPYWADPEIARRFQALTGELQHAYPYVRYEVGVYDLDSRGGRREKDFYAPVSS